jgi:FkbM family methyltransferase
MSRILGEQIRDAAVLRWVADNGDQTLSLEHPNLSEDSLVVDFGGYIGEWAHKVFTKYGCFIEIYEPAHEFVVEIEKRFKSQINNKIVVKECALGSLESHADLIIDGLATNIKKGDGNGTIFVASASKVLSERKIDLLKMNVEGSEYEIFDSLLENDLVKTLVLYLFSFIQ